MQRVLANDLWKTVVTQARRARRKRAAIAYVTQDLLGFRNGDTLLVDASLYAIGNGETDAKLLRTLHKKGVILYDCARLHAKVLLLDDVAVISSGNMSNSSANGLVEAGVITDHSGTVAGVASFIEQLVPQSLRLTTKHIAALCKIKVVRRGGVPTGSRKQRRPKVTALGNRTWLVGVRELVKEPKPEEQRLITRALKALHSQTSNSSDEPDWIRWTGDSRFVRECRPGDSLIQIWSSNRAKGPSGVMLATSVLLKQNTKRWTRFYLRTPTGRHAEMSWTKFKLLLKEVGESRRVGPGSALLLEPDIAEVIVRKWKSVVKS